MLVTLWSTRLNLRTVDGRDNAQTRSWGARPPCVSLHPRAQTIARNVKRAERWALCRPVNRRDVPLDGMPPRALAGAALPGVPPRASADAALWSGPLRASADVVRPGELPRGPADVARPAGPPRAPAGAALPAGLPRAPARLALDALRVTLPFRAVRPRCELARAAVPPPGDLLRWRWTERPPWPRPRRGCAGRRAAGSWRSAGGHGSPWRATTGRRGRRRHGRLARGLAAGGVRGRRLPAARSAGR